MLNIDQLKYNWKKPFYKLIKDIKQKPEVISNLNLPTKNIWWYKGTDWFFLQIGSHLDINREFVTDELKYKLDTELTGDVEDYLQYMFKIYYKKHVIVTDGPMLFQRSNRIYFQKIIKKRKNGTKI